jgi:hypothetical protein
MRPLRIVLAALAVMSLAACGGGSRGGSLPPSANDPGARAPSGSTVAFEKATLWVATDTLATAYSTNDNGAATALQYFGSISWLDKKAQPIPGIIDIAIAPDGTKWELENRDFAEGGPGWRLNAFAPNDIHNYPAENTYGDDVNRPFQLALAGDGIMVGYVNAVTKMEIIATYPYAASLAPPIRKFKTTGMYAFASGNDGHLYVARSNEFDVYAPDSNGCCPLRRIPLDAPLNYMGSPQGFAVGPDNTIYVQDLPSTYTADPVMYVNVYAPGSGTIGRRIGPLPDRFDVFSAPVITVDSKNRLYVATNGNIYRFAPGADGAAVPQRVITNHQGAPFAMAVGPAL